MLSAVVNPFISKDMEWFGCAVMLMGCALTTSNPTTIARKNIHFSKQQYGGFTI